MKEGAALPRIRQCVLHSLKKNGPSGAQTATSHCYQELLVFDSSSLCTAAAMINLRTWLDHKMASEMARGGRRTRERERAKGNGIRWSKAPSLPPLPARRQHSTASRARFTTQQQKARIKESKMAALANGKAGKGRTSKLKPLSLSFYLAHIIH